MHLSLGQHGAVCRRPAGMPTPSVHSGGTGLGGAWKQPSEFGVDRGGLPGQYREKVPSAVLRFLSLGMPTGVGQSLADPVGVGQQEGPAEGRRPIEPVPAGGDGPHFGHRLRSLDQQRGEQHLREVESTGSATMVAIPFCSSQIVFARLT